MSNCARCGHTRETHAKGLIPCLHEFCRCAHFETTKTPLTNHKLSCEAYNGADCDCGADWTPRERRRADRHIEMIEEMREDIDRLRKARDEAQHETAWLINHWKRENTTEACLGEWDKCGCDSCQNRKRLKAAFESHKTPYTAYEVYMEGKEEQIKRLEKEKEMMDCPLCQVYLRKTEYLPHLAKKHPKNTEEFYKELDRIEAEEKK